MKLTFVRPAGNGSIVVASMEVNGRVVERLVADTSTGTGPVPLERYVADQGGVRPVRTEGGSRDDDHRGLA